jgi:hypothetical protein
MPNRKWTIEDYQEMVTYCDERVSYLTQDYEEALKRVKELEKQLEGAKKTKERRVRLLNHHLGKRTSLPVALDTPVQ